VACLIASGRVREALPSPTAVPVQEFSDLVFDLV
jgi:hypothetical protein